MKKRFCSLLLASAVLLSLCACGASSAADGTKSETVLFTDSCGRTVELPREIRAVAPSGQAATLILPTIVPEKLVCIGAGIDEKQQTYLPEGLSDLPLTGQLYGGKSTLNLEELLATGAEVVVDLGDYKEGVSEALDALQEQTGIPCIFIEADLAHMAEAFRTLGGLFDREARGEELARLAEETLSMAAENSAKIADKDKISVMYSAGADPLGTNAQGSSQAQVLGLVGAVNAVAVENATSKGGGNIVNLEQVYAFDPDVILTTERTAYDIVTTDAAWRELRAVKSGRCYEIPAEPYCWLSSPPSMNMLLGVWWLGNLLYPEVYDYDMVFKAQEIYKTLWGYELSESGAREMLSLSTLK